MNNNLQNELAAANALLDRMASHMGIPTEYNNGYGRGDCLCAMMDKWDVLMEQLKEERLQTITRFHRARVAERALEEAKKEVMRLGTLHLKEALSHNDTMQLLVEAKAALEKGSI